MKNFYLFVAFLFFVTSLKSQNILDLKDQATVIDEIQKDRLENLLPQLMKRHNIDMWVLITREYNEDPIVKTFLPPTWLNARRRTIIVFSLKEGVFKSAAITRYPFGNLIPSVWDKEKEPDQWKALAKYIKFQNPKIIAVNTSENYALADGLVRTDFDNLINVLPENLASKVVSSEPLAVSWIETRTKREMIIYNQLVSITHNIIKEAFSSQVITPGIRLANDPKHDQKRVMTPGQAMKQGVDYLVIGRSITNSKDPLAKLKEIKLDIDSYIMEEFLNAIIS